MLQNRQIRIHPALHTILRTCLLRAIQTPTGDLARDAFLPAAVGKVVDAYSLVSFLSWWNCSNRKWNVCSVRAGGPSKGGKERTLLDRRLLSFVGEELVEFAFVAFGEFGGVDA